MSFRVAASLLVALTGCSVHDRTENRWIGSLTTKQPSPNCPTTKGVLLLREGNITFAPDEGTWILSGTAGPKTMTAIRSRPIADHKIFKTEFQAEWTESAVHGTYVTPDCTYQVDLARY